MSEATTTPTDEPAAMAKGYRLRVGERAAIVAPGRKSWSQGDWFVSLDGVCVDLVFRTELEAQEGARRLLSNPECPCWLQAREGDHQ